MAQPDTRERVAANAEATGITTFGFLPEEHDPAEGRLGNLFSRVKTVFGAGSVPQVEDHPPSPTNSFRQTLDTHRPPIASKNHAPQGRSVSLAAKRPDNVPRPTGDLEYSSSRSFSTSASSISLLASARVQDAPAGQKQASPEALAGKKKAKASAPDQRLSKGIPTTLRTAAPAPAVISMAPTHAIAHQQSHPGLTDDAESIAETAFGDLTSGIIDFSRLGDLNAHKPFTSIPGFPLSNDLLADDTQSIRSTSSRRQGSEASAEQRYGSSASTSLQMSAEAFRRLKTKGGAAQSKEWWMPDESAKECSACGSLFTLARRKHHCRCCGQIFCAKCAANLLPGTKLGLSGVVRVCNFCTQMIKQYDRARSGAEESVDQPKRGWTPEGRVRADMISAPLEAALVENAPQSRFAANALFGATALGGSAPDIHDARNRALHNASSFESLTDNETLAGHSVVPPSASDGQAPFRRGLGEEDHAISTEPPTEDQPVHSGFDSAGEPESGTENVAHPTPPIESSGVAFPSSDASPSKNMARSALDEARARLVSDASLSHENRARLVSDAAIRAFRRSRLKSRVTLAELNDKSSLVPGKDGLIESRPGSRLGGIQELQPESLAHLRHLLDQCFGRTRIPGKEKWAQLLLPLCLKVVQSVRPDALAHGKLMGVRRFVKIKRIPGGTPEESHMINGYICSHNVASKAMIRRLPLKNARVVLLAFPLTAVKGEGHFISLDNITASEKEYTRILVARVMALRPHLLVVRDQVSRLALELLEQAGVVVVWKVPDSSMSAIARVTQSDIVTSVDRLALQPRLGRCGTFAVDTYHSVLLPGKRRSFLRFTGTSRELGCSVILRGGGQGVLGQVKSILELCLLACHNLRLEEGMRDSSLALLPEPQSHHREHDLRDADADNLSVGAASRSTCNSDSSVLSALDRYRSTLLSISAHIQLPPPYPLIRLHQEGLTLGRLESAMDNQSEANSSRDTIKTEYQGGADGEMQNEKPDADHAQQLTTSTASLGESMDVEKQVQAVLPSEEAMSLQTKYALARARHSLDAQLVAPFTAGNDDLTPFAHQRLTMLHSFVSSATLKPCVGPHIERIDFYGNGDHTLGEFLSSKSLATSQACGGKNCGLQRILHYDSYIHDNVRVQCFCERFVCPIAGQENSILTWEYCKVCESATPVSVVNEDAKSYSWAKFLEAHFYTKHTKSTCDHKALADRIRYFAYKNLAFRVHVEQVRLFEVVVPGLRLFMRPDIQLQLKAEESLGLARRADAYFHSVAARLQALEHEIALGREGQTAAEKYQLQLEEIRDVALEGRRAVNDLVVSVVKETGPEDTLCLTRIRRRLQDVVVKVDGLFLSLERAALPKERDVRRLTTNHLSRLFAERDPLERGPEAANLPPAAELDEALPENLAAPDAPPESSVAAFARMADEAALGLPPHLGLPFDTMPLSGSTTPSSTTRPPSKKSSLQNSQHSSGTVTPTRNTLESGQDPGSHDRSFRSKSGHVLLPDQPADDSDGNSSPTQLKPPVRPRPRKGKAAALPHPPISGMITDSSCTEAGEATDAPIVSSLVSQFDAGSTPMASAKDAKPRKAEPQSQRVKTASQTQRIHSDGESLPPSRAPSRPISPVHRHRKVGPAAPTFSRTQSGPTGREKAPVSRDRPARAAPPSSYRPLNTRGRASESESDAPNMRNALGGRNLPAGLPFASRPPLSRRASGKSDSGSESPARPFRRKVSGPKPPAAPRAPSRVPVPSTSARGRVSTIARHFDRINREAERERERQKRALALRARRALPIAVSSARIAEYTSVTAAVESDESSDEDGDEDHEGRNDSHSDGGEEADSEAEPDGPESLPKREVRSSTPLGTSLEEASGTSVTHDDKAAGNPSTSTEQDSSVSLATEVEKLLPNIGRPPPATPTSGEHAAMERGSLLKTISSFWASRTGVVLPLLEYPLSSEQHLFADSPLLLREDEPSSTIAFTLVSAQYKDRLRSLRSARNDSQASSSDADASMASWNIVEHQSQHQSNDIESSLRRPEGVHLRFDFESGTSRFHCRILFSEQFDALRRCCGCEDSIIGSLARCVKWDSSGGKSKMTFLKTRDDRLVLKQLSSSELTSFSTFAPHYFAHMAECLMHGKATTLVKLFGLYRISMRNQATGKSYKLDVLVMENLFYGRKCSRIFDLKGSMRNRYVKETGATGEVLLDENLVEISLQKPLFIREASKAMLRHALKHDSDFLADMNIMDYSVIIGVDATDEDNPELVVGIIDFLRSYTWDKRVETFVKEQSSLLGAAKGELPTVITPKQYANRFLSFLDGILLLSPDSWYNDTSRGAAPYTGGGKSGGGYSAANQGEAVQVSEKK